MSSPSTPKTMSSRLLTMKFMQRAAAASTTSSAASTPAPAEPSSSKRRKVSHDPASPNDTAFHVNQAAVRAAIEEEEKKVEGALLKRAIELGDARWVLEVPKSDPSNQAKPSLNIVRIGYAQIDSGGADDGSDSDPSEPSFSTIPALRRFNMNKKKPEKPKKTKIKNEDSNSDSDASSNSDSEASSPEPSSDRPVFKPSPLSTLKHPAAQKLLRGKKSEEQLKAKKLAQKRREKEMKLNNSRPSPLSGGGLASISTGGGRGGAPVSMSCYKCGKTGHKALECPLGTKRKDR